MSGVVAVLGIGLLTELVLVHPPIRALPAISLWSSLENGVMLTDLTCHLADVPPTISWGRLPPPTQELALTAVDESEAGPRSSEWVVYSIPPNADAVGITLPAGAIRGKTGHGDSMYRGPCDPQISVHVYRYEVFALDRKMHFGPGLTREAVLSGIVEHVIGHGELTVDFTLSTNTPSALHELRSYSDDSHFTWTTSGVAPGTYLVEAWARPKGSPNGLEVAGMESVNLGPGEADCSPTLRLEPSEPTVPGTAVAVAVSGSGCPQDATYAFLIDGPIPTFEFGRDFSNGFARDFSSATSFVWTPTQEGTYWVEVWVRYSTTTSPYAVAAYKSHEVHGNVASGMCSSAMVRADPSAARAGARIQITASATGCASPEFRFWYQSAQSEWDVSVPRDSR